MNVGEPSLPLVCCVMAWTRVKAPLFPLPLPTAEGRRADPAGVMKARELTCPSLSAAFGRVGYASHLGNTVELALMAWAPVV